MDLSGVGGMPEALPQGVGLFFCRALREGFRVSIKKALFQRHYTMPQGTMRVLRDMFRVGGSQVRPPTSDRVGRSPLL